MGHQYHKTMSPQQKTLWTMNYWCGLRSKSSKKLIHKHRNCTIKNSPKNMVNKSLKFCNGTCCLGLYLISMNRSPYCDLQVPKKFQCPCYAEKTRWPRTREHSSSPLRRLWKRFLWSCGSEVTQTGCPREHQRVALRSVSQVFWLQKGADKTCGPYPFRA